MTRNYLIASLLMFTFGTGATSINATEAQTVASQSKYVNQIDLNQVSKSPYTLIQAVGAQIFQSVAQAKAENPDNIESMKDIVEYQLMPFIDVKFASYKILGAQVKKSTKEERRLFVEAMESNLIKTYSSALAQYKDQQIKFEKAKPYANKKTVVVKTELLATGQPTINMLFKLRKNKKTGQWKAYDLVVEGISLVDSKRAELSNLLRTNGIKYVAENVLD